MKQLLIFTLLCCINISSLLAQAGENIAATIGFRKGYTNVVGAEIEYLISEVGFEIGGGYEGYGAAINFHFERDIHSSAFKIFYANTDTRPIINSHHIGMALNFRFAGFLSLNIGAAYSLEGDFGLRAADQITYPIGIGYYHVLNITKG